MSNRTMNFDPDGSWKDNRFDFCNALEAVAKSNTPEARAVLAKFGVTVSPFVKPPINYVHAKGATLQEVQANMRSTPLYAMGDCTLVWVNEGDFWLNDPVDLGIAAMRAEEGEGK